MNITIRKIYTGGAGLKVAIERPASGLHYDFADSTFKATPTTADLSLTPGAGRRAAIFSATVAGLPEDDYVLEYYDATSGGLVDIEGVPVIVDERVKAVLVGDVVRNAQTGVNTFASADDSDTPVVAFAPASDGLHRYVTDLRTR